MNKAIKKYINVLLKTYSTVSAEVISKTVISPRYQTTYIYSILQLKLAFIEFKIAFLKLFLPNSYCKDYHVIRFKPVTFKDWRIIYKWRTDPLSMASSFNTNKIYKMGHLEWFRKMLFNDNQNIFIANIAGHQLGCIRTTVEEDVCELGWIVNPLHRKMGVGKKMVSVFAKSIDMPLIAKIKSDNYPSMKIAYNAGMRLNFKCETYSIYKKG